MLTENIDIGFCVDRYKNYQDLPLDILDDLPFCVYIVDYNWTYLFVNKISTNFFGKEIQNLVGKNAQQVFGQEKFQTIFENIHDALKRKTICDTTIYSPLRGKQVKVKGYPLDDCYYFYTVTLPSKEELMDELRRELNKRKASLSETNFLP
jgi:hypothetical protein